MNLKKVLTTSFLITALGASAETTTNSQQVARPQMFLAVFMEYKMLFLTFMKRLKIL